MDKLKLKMTVYHATDASEAILANGFKDSEGNYFTTEQWCGVWVADVPVDANEGAKGDVVLRMEIPTEVFIQYEWVEEGAEDKNYREALIPASILNSYGRPQICTDGELDSVWEKRWTNVDDDSKTTTKKQMAAEKLAAVISELPSEETLHRVVSQISKKNLDKYGHNHPLMVEWVRRRELALLRGIAIKLRFEHNKDDAKEEPVLLAHEIGEIDTYTYESLVYETDFWESIFDLVEGGWQYLEYEFNQVLGNDYPPNECDFLLKCMEEFYDEDYYKCFVGYKKTIREIEDHAKKLRTFSWQPTEKGDWLNKSKWEAIEEKHGCIWMKFAFNVLDKYSKQDTVLLEQLNNFKKNIASMSDLQANQATKERGKNPPRRYVSRKWKKGIYYVGTTGGFKPCTIKLC